jgi:hypothetical protein
VPGIISLRNTVVIFRSWYVSELLILQWIAAAGHCPLVTCHQFRFAVQ